MRGLERWTPLALPLLLALPDIATTQELQTFTHPRHPVSIDAPADWQAAAWPGDPGVFEVRSPDGSVRALLWFTATEMSAPRYLGKMIGMKPLTPVGEAVLAEVGGRESWQIVAIGREQGDANVRERFAVFNTGPDASPEGNYILQVWCPEVEGERLSPVIDRVVHSFRIASGKG
jgi:hypothetical protein